MGGPSKSHAKKLEASQSSSSSIKPATSPAGYDGNRDPATGLEDKEISHRIKQIRNLDLGLFGSTWANSVSLLLSPQPSVLAHACVLSPQVMLLVTIKFSPDGGWLYGNKCSQSRSLHQI